MHSATGVGVIGQTEKRKKRPERDKGTTYIYTHRERALPTRFPISRGHVIGICASIDPTPLGAQLARAVPYEVMPIRRVDRGLVYISSIRAARVCCRCSSRFRSLSLRLGPARVYVQRAAALRADVQTPCSRAALLYTRTRAAQWPNNTRERKRVRERDGERWIETDS